MLILDQHIGAHQIASLGGREHGRVVAGAQQHRRTLRAARVNPVDEGEFAYLTYRRSCIDGRALSLPTCVLAPAAAWASGVLTVLCGR